MHHTHAQAQHMVPSGSHSTISHWSNAAAAAGYSSDASSLDSDVPNPMQQQYYMRHSVSPSQSRDNPLVHSGPIASATRFQSSGASSLPTNLPSSAMQPYPGVQYNPAHAQFMDALGSGFNMKGDPNSDFFAADPSVTPTIAGAAFTTYSGNEMMTDGDMKDSLMDTSTSGVDLSRTPLPLETESPALRRNTASPSLVAIGRGTSNVSPGRRGGSGPIGYSASELRGRSSPAIVSHMSGYGGGLPAANSPSNSHLAPPAASSSGMVVDSPPSGVRSPNGTSTPRSFSPNSGRQAFVRGSSKSPGANQMDPETTELLQVLDAFVTVFEPRGPINMDINWTPQEARPYWQLLMKEERRDELGLMLAEIQQQLATNDHASALKKLIRLFEHCVMLLCGSSALNWHGAEVRLAAQAEKMVPLLGPEVLNFELADAKDKECDRLIDALALYATYFRDRQQVQPALNALMLAYNQMSSNSSKLSIEAVDRLYIWTLYCVSMPQERNQWLSMITALGVHPGQTPMALMVTQQAGLISSFAAGSPPNRDQLIRLWRQLDEFEQLIQMCEKSHRSRPFRYLRLAAASILRAEVLTRFEYSADANLWIRHLQEIASMSPGLKVSLITSIKAISEAVVDGEIRGLTCGHNVLSLLESTQTNTLQ